MIFSTISDTFIAQKANAAMISIGTWGVSGSRQLLPCSKWNLLSFYDVVYTILACSHYQLKFPKGISMVIMKNVCIYYISHLLNGWSVAIQSNGVYM